MKKKRPFMFTFLFAAAAVITVIFILKGADTPGMLILRP